MKKIPKNDIIQVVFFERGTYMKTVKNRITSVLGICTAALLLVSGTAAAYSVSDVLHLQDALLGRSEIAAADDINKDGAVNAFDLGILKKQLLQPSGEEREASFAATEEHVRITGRNLTTEDTLWLVQSGSAAEFIVSGTSASVQLAGDAGIEADADHRPRYAVFVDGELLIDKTMDEKQETITLWEKGSHRTATIKVIMLSEAMYGAIGVKSVDVTSAAPIPVKPTAKKELCIEFIGDSITCAYGVEGASSSESFKTTTENFTKSYAYLTAMQLDADYSAVCYSGHGIVSGYSSGDKNSESLVPDCYTKTTKNWQYTEEWDFSKIVNDVVVINLGTNDINYVGKEPETRSPEFVEGYIAFLEMIREKNPDAYMICTVGTMGGEEIYELIAQAVDTYKSDSKDERVMSYASVTQNMADGIGSDWHPSPVTQQNSAYVLADQICQALGMESSKIGLNAAADSVYTSSHNADSGANVYAYVNEYDKSFWLNVSDGGDVPEDIEAIIPDIPLQKGAEYRLEFDYTSTVDVEIPLVVRGTEEYYSDKIEAVSEKLHYEQNFTVSQDDDKAQLVFFLGGNDYYNATFSNIRVIKVK